MNDVFYGLMRNVMGVPYNLGNYYSLWLIPQTTKLFNLNLGFTVIEVQSWMMAASIYLRIGVIFALLGGHTYLLNRWNAATHLSIMKQKVKVGGLNPIKQYEPEILVLPPEALSIEEEA